MAIDQDRVAAFKALRDADFANKAFADKGYGEFVPRLLDAYKMIDELISIANANPVVSDAYSSKINDYIIRFIDATKSALIQPAQIGNQSLEQFANQARMQLREFIERVYGGRRDNSSEEDLRITYSQIKAQVAFPPMGEYLEKLNALNKYIDTSISIKAHLESESGSKAADKFAKFYSQEAYKYSGGESGTGWWKNGVSNRWLAGICVCTLLLIIAVFCFPKNNEEKSLRSISVSRSSDTALSNGGKSLRTVTSKFDSVISSPTSSWSTEHIVSNVLPHVLFISILIFAIRFMSKQYSVSRHIYAVNRHKANLASTFISIMDSIPGEDRDARTAVLTTTVNSLATYIPAGYVESGDPEVTAVAEVAKTLASKAK